MKRMIGMGLWGVGSWCAPAHRPARSSVFRHKGEIVVSFNRGTPPFCMEVKGELAGLDVDLARFMADALGVKPKFIFPAVYDEQIPKLLAGESGYDDRRHDPHGPARLERQFQRPLFRGEPGRLGPRGPNRTTGPILFRSLGDPGAAHLASNSIPPWSNFAERALCRRVP